MTEPPNLLLVTVPLEATVYWPVLKLSVTVAVNPLMASVSVANATFRADTLTVVVIKIESLVL